MENYSSDQEHQEVSSNTSLRNAYNISAVIIFLVMAYTFLFPCNKLIPLDRRTVAVLCSVLCYITRTYAFHGRSMNILEAIDWDVLGNNLHFTHT
jgi:Na+/H+ antiporter NhaD/arsenite permease-like protein